MQDPFDESIYHHPYENGDGDGGDEPNEYEGIDEVDSEAWEKPIEERSLIGIDAMEEKFVYQDKTGWSAPFSARHIKARLKAGLLSEDILIRRVTPDGVTNRSFPVAQMPGYQETERSVMASRNNVGTAREVSGLIKEATDALSGWSDAAAWHEHATSLEKVDKFFKAAELFSKVSVGLGLIGAGLGIIDAFLGEDDTDKILNAIEKLDDKLDSLQTLMLAQFEKLKQIVEVSHARTQIRPYLNKLNTIRDIVLNYEKVALNPSLREGAIDRVLEFKRADVFECVQGIFSQSAGTQQANNIFHTTYHASYGDMKMITDLGSTLHSFCVFGLMADNLISSLDAKRKGVGNKAMAHSSAINATFLYQPLIDGVLAAWRTESNKCRYSVKVNMVRMMETDILPKLSALDHGAAAIQIRNTLRAKWYWLDWLAIVYNPIHSLYNHGYKGSTKSWLRRNISDGQANIIVKYIDRSNTPEGKNASTRYSYRFIDWGKSLAKGFPFWGGEPVYETAYMNAEDKDWEDVRDMFSELSGQHRSPGLIWACRRYQGAFYACNNKARFKWINGTHFTICIYR